VGRTAYLFLFLDNGETRETLDPKFTAAQMRWLSAQIAGHKRDAIILLMHVPFREDPFFNALVSTIRTSWRISLLLAGHRHTNGIEEITLGGHPVTQVRTGSLKTISTGAPAN
jgi:2',3'-cyclic-nucleotide 2'-phosphodiesterase (5'-nucleotidase family)